MPAYIVFYGNQIRGTHEEHLHQTKAIKLQENLEQHWNHDLGTREGKWIKNIATFQAQEP